jgi:hypothetical protein
MNRISDRDAGRVALLLTVSAFVFLACWGGCRGDEARARAALALAAQAPRPPQAPAAESDRPAPESAQKVTRNSCCSPACTCGCRQGEPCGCEGDRAGRARAGDLPATTAAPAPQRTHAPAPPAAVLVPFTYGQTGYVYPQQQPGPYYPASPAYYQPARSFVGGGRRGGSC